MNVAPAPDEILNLVPATPPAAPLEPAEPKQHEVRKPVIANVPGRLGRGRGGSGSSCGGRRR